MLEKVPSWVFALVAALSLMLSVFLLICPHYYLGAADHYVTNHDSSVEYILPKTSAAWAFLAAGLAFLALTLVAFGFYVKRLQHNGAPWGTPRLT